MPTPTYFVQECPTCGRALRVRVEYLGRAIACQHCHATFDACDPATGLSSSMNSGSSLLRRAEALIELANRSRLNQQAAT